jgi:phage-related protein
MIPMKDSFVKIFKSITKVFEEDMNGTYQFYLKLVQGTTSLVEPLFKVFDDILKKFADNLESIMPIIKDFFHVINRFFSSTLSKFFQILPGLINFGGLIIEFIIDFATLMIEIFAPVILFLADIFMDLFEVIWVIGEIIWDVIIQLQHQHLHQRLLHLVLRKLDC